MAWADFDDARYWRECAKEARATAELITDATAKELMLDIAAGYEWLARRAEERTSRGAGLHVQP